LSRTLPEDAIETLSVFVSRQDLEQLQVMTGRPWEWLPWMLGAGGVTLGRRVFLRRGRYRIDTARGLALLAHEAMHVGQYREMGWGRFLWRYGRGLVQARFDHDSHPMEASFVVVQRRVHRSLREAGFPDG
jgi:hypothetical protein